MHDDPDCARDAALREATFDNGAHNLRVPFLEVEALAEALRSACAADAELDVIQQAALDYLLLATGVSRFAEYRARVSAAFDSSSITFTGSFGLFKQQLKVGLGLADAPFGHAGPEVRIAEVQIVDRSFEWVRAEGSTLQTCRASFQVKFDFLAVTDDAVQSWTGLAQKYRDIVAQRYRGILESSDGFMPQQRLNLQNIQVHDVQST